MRDEQVGRRKEKWKGKEEKKWVMISNQQKNLANLRHNVPKRRR
jgi:hypothetical protein